MKYSATLQNLSDQELLIEAAKRKKEKAFHNFIIGFLVGVAVFSTYRKGVSFFTFFPLFFMPLAYQFSKKHKEVENILKSKNLK